MEKVKMERINQLAKESKLRQLSPEELAEQAALRQEYVAEIRANLRTQLDNTYIVDEKGNKRPLPRKQ